jgi:GT2 family glycosyltransferase
MIDIVIVNWNSGSFLGRCVNSILESTSIQHIASVIIIDNHSSDFSLTSLPKHNKIILLQNEKNRGFARACNQGFHLCTAEYTLLLNPDAYLLPDTLHECLLHMEAHPDIAILGCRLQDDYGKTSYSCSRFPSPTRIFFDATGLSKIAPRLFHPATIMTDWPHDSSRFVSQVMGAFMFIRTSIFNKYGYFDERYFVYFEEVDYCKRIAIGGEKIFYNHSITAVHTGEGTTSSVKAFRLYLSLRSRLLYAKKHFSLPGLIVVAICNYLIEPLSRTFYLLLKGNLREVSAVWKAMHMLIKNQLPG